MRRYGRRLATKAGLPRILQCLWTACQQLCHKYQDGRVFGQRGLDVDRESPLLIVSLCLKVTIETPYFSQWGLAPPQNGDVCPTAILRFGPRMNAIFFIELFL